MEDPPPAERKEDCNSQALAEKEPTFMPPLYIQRYNLVREIMTEHNITSVLDCGSAECRIMQLLKTAPSLERVALLDVDEELLWEKSHNARPLVLELVMPDRPRALHVQVFAGDAGSLDSRVADFEAVSMVELIEHLYEEDLRQVTENVFGRMQPRLVVITTPNSNYNKLFSLGDKFRHWDHKFEWTQEEFENWCAGVCGRYGYEVRYTGVGRPPAEAPECGFCSQAGVFSRLQARTSSETGEECYKLIYESTFPAQKPVSKTDQINCEAVRYISVLEQDCAYENPEEGECRKARVMGRFRLADVYHCPSLQELCSLPELRESLATLYEISEDGNFVYVPTSWDDPSDEEDEKEDEEAVASGDEGGDENNLPTRDSGGVTELVLPVHEDWD